MLFFFHPYFQKWEKQISIHKLLKQGPHQPPLGSTQSLIGSLIIGAVAENPVLSPRAKCFHHSTPPHLFTRISNSSLKDLLSTRARFFPPTVCVSSYLSVLPTPSRSMKGYYLLKCSFQDCFPCHCLRSFGLELSDSVGLCSGITEVVRQEICIYPSYSESPLAYRSQARVISWQKLAPVCPYILGQVFAPSYFSVFPSCRCVPTGSQWGK